MPIRESNIGNTGSPYDRAFKNEGKNKLDSRKRRLEKSVELRKQKVTEQLRKRRQIFNNSMSPDASLSDASFSGEKSSIKEIILLMKSVDSSDNLNGAKMARQLLSKENCTLIQEIVDSPIMSYLVRYLDKKYDDLIVFESAWAITNIASGNSQQTTALVSTGVLPKIISLLGSKNLAICEQAVWALGNICGEGPQFRDGVIKLDVIEHMKPLAERMREMTVTFLRTFSWTLSNLCRNKNPYPPEWAVKKIIILLRKMLSCKDDNIYSDICWALSYLTDGPDHRAELVINSGVLDKAIEVYNSTTELSVLTPCLRIIGNVVSGNENNTAYILNGKVHLRFGAIIRMFEKQLGKEIMWAISNIAAGTHAEIQQIFDASLLPHIIHCYTTGNKKVKNECTWIINNICNCGSQAQMNTIIESNVFKAMVESFRENDTKLNLLLMETIRSILTKSTGYGEAEKMCLEIEESGLLDSIESLQESTHPDVYQCAVGLIEDYFMDDEFIE